MLAHCLSYTVKTPTQPLRGDYYSCNTVVFYVFCSQEVPNVTKSRDLLQHLFSRSLFFLLKVHNQPFTIQCFLGGKSAVVI